jgi:putative chitinase
LATPEYAVRSACWWWKAHGLNQLADKDEFTKVTRIINGGLNGRIEREKFLYLANRVRF